MITTIEIRGDSVATAIIIPKKTKKRFCGYYFVYIISQVYYLIIKY